MVDYSIHAMYRRVIGVTSGKYSAPCISNPIDDTTLRQFVRMQTTWKWTLQLVVVDVLLSRYNRDYSVSFNFTSSARFLWSSSFKVSFANTKFLPLLSFVIYIFVARTKGSRVSTKIFVCYNTFGIHTWNKCMVNMDRRYT